MNPTPRTCRHDGYHSGQARYRRDLARLRYVVVCDDCHTELREISSVDYRPQFLGCGRPSQEARD
jgi:hypothetical protein